MRIKKHKYLRVIKFNSNKSSEVIYYKNTTPNHILINPDHVFNYNGYRTIVISDKSAETINPLDFESKFDKTKFESAIESKLIKDAFTSLKPKIDMTTVLLILNIVFSLAIVYLIMKGQGMI